MADEERLVVSMEARINDFEKRMKQAERTGTQSFQKLQAGSQRAARQMQQDLAQSANAVNRSTGSIIARLTSANDNLAKLGQRAGEVPRAIGAATSSISMMGKALAGLAVAGVASEFVSMADTAKRLESQLRLVTSSAEELTTVQAKLFAIAQAGRSDYEATVQLYSKLARSTKDLGLSQDQVIRTTDLINKSFKISGASSEEAKNAITQLAQGLQSGALRGDEFNSVSEQAPRLLQAVAAAMGKTTGEVRTLAGEGKITAGVIINSLGKSAETIDKEFGQLGVTVGDASTNLRNSLLRAIGDIDKRLGASSGISTGIMAIAKSIDYLSTNMGSIVEAAQPVALALATAFGPAIVTSIIQMIQLLSVGMVGALRAVAIAAAANPFGAFVVGLTAAVTAAYYFRDEINKAIGVDVFGTIKDVANYIVNSFVAAYSDIGFVWQNLPLIVAAAAKGAANAVISAVQSMVNTVIQGINTLVGGINAVISTLGGEAASQYLGFSGQIGKISEITLNKFENDTGDLQKAAEEHVKKFNDIMSTDNFGAFGKALGGATQEAGSLDTALDKLPSSLSKTAQGMGGAGKAAKQASHEFEQFARQADGLVEKMFPAAAARQEADELQKQLDRFGSKLTDIQRKAVELRIGDLNKAASLGLRDLETDTARSGENMANSLQDTLGSTLSDIFSGPMKSWDDLMDKVFGDLAKIGQQNIQNLFSGKGGTAGGQSVSVDFKPNTTFGEMIGALPKRVQTGAAAGSLQGSALGAAAGTGSVLDSIFGQTGGSLISAGLGGAGIGYQTQSPIMGAIGGALSGWGAGAALGSAGGPIGAAIGAAAGPIGGRIGKLKRKLANDSSEHLLAA